jgi:hypothetical protein
MNQALYAHMNNKTKMKKKKKRKVKENVGQCKSKDPDFKTYACADFWH